MKRELLSSCYQPILLLSTKRGRYPGEPERVSGRKRAGFDTCFQFNEDLSRQQLMSMKLSSVDDDAEGFGGEHERRNTSSLSLRYQHKRQEGRKTPHLIYISIICLLALALFIISGSRSTGSNDAQIKQLAEQVNQIRGRTESNVQQIQSMKGAINSNSNNKPAQPAPVIPAVQAPRPVVTIMKNKPKGEYMRPQLEKVAEKRRQAGGMKPEGKGTPSQMTYLKKNSDGKTIDQVLYDEKSQEGRKAFHKQRAEFLSAKKNLQSIYLASFNGKTDESRNEEQKKEEADEFARLDKIWHFEKYPQQLPMCLIVPGYNNNAKFRIEYNLNSIFQQNYTNYFAVIVNDASTDNSDETYLKYLDFYGIDKATYAYVENKERKTALENIYMATHEYCSPDSIAVTLDADDEFIGKNVLKIFNAAYQEKKAGVIYSNFYWYDQGRNIMLGFTSEYTKADKDNRNYRSAPQRFSQLRSYRSELFLQIDAKAAFQDDEGKFFRSAYDMAMLFPLMELSCGRVNKIEGFHYLYNINTGLNDYALDRNKQVRIDQTVRRRPKLNCYEPFEEKMKKAS